MKLNFKIRCSAIGSIMGGSVGLTVKQAEELEALSKKEKLTVKQGEKLEGLISKRDSTELPAGCTTYLQGWMKEQIYGRRKEIKSKYLSKGNECEDPAIDFAERFLDLPFSIKNEKYFEDEFLTGTPDLLVGSEVIDIKNSFSFETFPLFDTVVKNSGYVDQLQGYMALTGLRKARLIYCLMDAPEWIIEKEARSIHYDTGLSARAAEAKARKLLTYPDIEDKLKIKAFDVPYNQARVDAIIERVKLCKDFVNSEIKRLGL